MNRAIAPDAVAAYQHGNQQYDGHHPSAGQQQERQPQEGEQQDDAEHQSQKGRNNPHCRTDRVAVGRNQQQNSIQQCEGRYRGVPRFLEDPENDFGSTTPIGKCCQVLLVALSSQNITEPWLRSASHGYEQPYRSSYGGNTDERDERDPPC